ncbi:alpha/beta hydrolase family protein [Gynurincola endophyticus]|uniref:alpha/beta hydrolase family protein n=1 Tax=Gynurincola endophyticus TaxID=2479004 RepID=UPI000F8C5421|nr:alpha/beta fold hydrolase [Gynurincola endophyticus]
MKKIFVTIGLLSLIFSCFSQNINGTWNGNLEVQPGRKIVFIFTISHINGKLTSNVSIPSQGVKDLITNATIFENNELLIDASNLGFKYTGKWNTSHQTIEGNFREGVNSVPLLLTREVIEQVKLKRPQEPVKPYPYREEKITFSNQEHHITLAGTLTLPNSSGKKPPVVILISGSGPQDRDESFAGHKPFLVLADFLTRKGIAVLRYDDRGFGESTGNFSEATTADFATDVRSAIDFLKKRTDIDTLQIGLIGHSEGAIIAPMVANQSNNLSFIVMLAGTGIPGKEVSLHQALDYRNFNVTDEQAYEAYVKQAIEIASSVKEASVIRKELTRFYQQSALLASLLPSTADKEEFINNLVSTRTTPWISYFYNYNPADEIMKLNIPALALYGSKDTQVPPKYHLQPVQNALAASNSPTHKVVLLEGLNHLFQESQTGQISEYPQIEQTFSPKALQLIVNWIIEHTK